MLIMYFSLDQKDRDLVEDIYIDLNKKLYNYGLSLLKNKEDTEEALSLTYIKIMENLEKIRALPEEKLKAYCFTILYSQAMDIFRKKNKFSPLEDMDLLVDERSPSPEAQVAEALVLEELKAYIKDLAPDDQRLLILRYKYELDFIDIGTILNISPEAARKRKERLIKSLRLKLKGEDKND